jgi:hypothetical protein
MATKISNADRIEADIDRWFSSSPFGILLKGDDGRVWRLTEAQATDLRQQAMDDVQDFVSWQHRKQVLSLALMLTLCYHFDWLAETTTDAGMPWLMLPLGLICFAPLTPFLWLLLFRRRQRRLKRNFVRSLNNAVPLNREIAVSYLKKNSFSGVSAGVVFTMILALIVVEQFVPRRVEAIIGIRGMAVFIITGVALALIFELLSRIQDQRNKL